MPLARAVSLLLGLLRETGAPHKVATQSGHYQQSLSAHKAHQLLRLRIDPALGLVPEIIGHRLVWTFLFCLAGVLVWREWTHLRAVVDLTRGARPETVRIEASSAIVIPRR